MLLPVQEDRQQLGVHQRVDGIVVNLLAILVGRDGVTAQEVDHFSLGDLILGVFIDNCGHDVAGAWNRRCASGRVLARWGPREQPARSGREPRQSLRSAPRTTPTTIQPGLCCTSNRSPSRVWSLSITLAIHAWDATGPQLHEQGLAVVQLLAIIRILLNPAARVGRYSSDWATRGTAHLRVQACSSHVRAVPDAGPGRSTPLAPRSRGSMQRRVVCSEDSGLSPVSGSFPHTPGRAWCLGTRMCRPTRRLSHTENAP